MSERKVHTDIVGQQYTNDGSIIDEEIIDVSVLAFDDTDDWLYLPRECKVELMGQDLYSWLKEDPEQSVSVNRRSIDTRTFTRSKKRSGGTNFESILASLSAPVSNIWKNSQFSTIQGNHYAEIYSARKEEAIPPMLTMPPNARTSLLSDGGASSSGQQSMEEFLNMSQSKGIDSFINLVEPGICNPLMNISQPSILYSSIISSKDDSLHNSTCVKVDDSANGSHSHNQEDNKLEGTVILNTNEHFLLLDKKDNNESYCISSADRTYINKPDLSEDDLNKTYDTDAASTTVVLANPDKDKSGETLSSTFVNMNNNVTIILRPENTEEKNQSNLNSTFTFAPQLTENLCVLDATYSAKDVDVVNGEGITQNDTRNECHKDQSFDLQRQATYNITKTLTGSSTPIANSSFTITHDDLLNSMFTSPTSFCNQSTPKNTESLNSTFSINIKKLESAKACDADLHTTMKAPTSLRRELLSKIFTSGDHKLDFKHDHITKDHQNGTFKNEITENVQNHDAKNDIPVENKYNTYKKETLVSKMKPPTEVVNEDIACVQNLQDKKYYTFTKKGSNAYGGKTDMENVEPSDNVDATFVKPLPKFQKQKQHVSKTLSKLPQFLQKSNPNLVSNSLKTVKSGSGRNVGTFGYIKRSHPNIVRDVEKGLGNKLYSFENLKSGSEQRLLELNSSVAELQILGAGGSTESIESTQSAHSAPDLDDRLSTCSDSSHNSCATQPMNIEQLHQIVHMQEESLKQDATSQLNRRVLETMRVDNCEDVPSAILKAKSNGGNIVAKDCTVKTSTPMLIPTKSSQLINTEGQIGETVLDQHNEGDGAKNMKAFNKPLMKIENKTTRLRQPTNWNTGTRPTNVMSAIPRPPSRIPGPRFVRPAVKNIQGDIKRGYT